MFRLPCKCLTFSREFPVRKVGPFWHNITWDERHHGNSACLLPGASRFCQRSLLNTLPPHSVLNQGRCQAQKEVTHVWQEAASGTGQVSPSRSSSSWSPSAGRGQECLVFHHPDRAVFIYLAHFNSSSLRFKQYRVWALRCSLPEATALDLLARLGSWLFSVTGADAAGWWFGWFPAAASACSLLHDTAGRRCRCLYLPGLHLLSSSDRPPGTTPAAAGWD